MLYIALLCTTSSPPSGLQLSRLVAENIFSFDPKFWMRVATRNDSLADAAAKERLKAVADTVMVLVDTMVRQTEQKLNDSAAVLQVRRSASPVAACSAALRGCYCLHSMTCGDASLPCLPPGSVRQAT